VAQTVEHPELVPDIEFYNIQKHIDVLQELLKDLLVGGLM
jgi:hypothetical protein